MKGKFTPESQPKREVNREVLHLTLRILAREAVASMFTTMDLTDNRTARRSAAAAQWATDIAEALNLSEHEVTVTYLATLLHDVGMMAIPDAVLDCPGELDPVAWAMVRTHCQNGENILSTIDQFDELAKAVLSHHEHYDGKGYPLGLAGEEIPLISRIICVADSYSAMMSNLPYRPKLSLEMAQAELGANKGTQFDPGLVDTFLRGLEQHDDDYQRGEQPNFSVEFQKVKLLCKLDAECSCHLEQRHHAAHVRPRSSW